MKHKAGRKNREIPVDVTDTNIFDSANILERNIQKKNGQWWINQLLQPHPIKTIRPCHFRGLLEGPR